ncbi:clostripain-related cysteine peptidase [Hyalangium gracile]|uniref:clostripain-related cysteine peptidase n=1 Tax=Hyalangium gracile TaxID=394092 RepID=UPI001CCD39CD|nr:clostripain-related cysteine peptidase [Hyalangium gracile]
MKVLNAPTSTPRPATSSGPSSKALPPSRGNELAPQRSVDAFESSSRGTQSRPAMLTGEQPSRALATPQPTPGPTPAAATGPISPKDIPAAEWTVFVHLNADNNLESFGKDDMNEMEAGGGSIQGKLNLIALVDGGAINSDGWNTGARLMYVGKDPENSRKIVSREIEIDPKSELGKMLAAGKGELDTGSPEVLRAALDYVQRNTESKHYMVDLWDHGNGWRGVSYDDNPSSSLDMHELQKALTGLPQKVDLLTADACLMATVEVAATAKAIGSDFLVGSEELEPGTGWDYKDLLGRMGKLFQGSGSVSAEQMAKAIQESYAAGPRDNVTMSVTNLSKLDGLNSKLNDFSDALLQAGGLQNATLRSAYDKALRFDDADQMDLGDFARRISQGTKDAALKKAADALLSELAATTSEKGAKGDPKFAAATGLSIYSPRGSVDSAYKKEGAAWLDSHWNNVIKTYSATPRS